MATREELDVEAARRQAEARIRAAENEIKKQKDIIKTMKIWFKTKAVEIHNKYKAWRKQVALRRAHATK